MPPVDLQLEKALQEHADTLTTHLRDEVTNLRKLQEVRARVREAKIDEGAKSAKSADKAATNADMKLTLLLEQYTAQEEQKLLRRRFYMRFVLPSVISAVLGGGGVTTWLVATDDTPPKTTTNEIKRTVEDRVDKLEESQAAVGQRIERMGDLHFEEQELWLDGLDNMNKRLDAISDRLRVNDEQEEPETVKQAREQVKAYKRRKEHRELESSLKKGDPFSDLAPLDSTRPDPVIVEPDVP